ncbi:fibronectin type III domain-containing protein [Abditibacterium utsteinense]|nr:fibronectin type III domain-containing protein [Abditibacterium utsteinense]
MFFSSQNFARSAALAAFLVLTGVSRAQVPTTRVAVTTSHNDNARTGFNASETVLNTSNVNVARFGKLFSRAVDGKIWCQPLYVPGVDIAGKGLRNVVYLMTERGSVYAFDADNPAETAPLWKTTVLPDNATGGMPDQNVGSPVIDASSSTIYFTIKNQEGAWVFRLFALDIRTGIQKQGSGSILSATVAGHGKGSVNGTLTFKAQTQKQRPSLLLSGGKIYAAFGGSVDEYDPYVVWNGWIFVFDAATLQRQQVLAVAPNANGAGIWQAGNGLSADASGNVYTVAANGNGIGPDGAGEMYSFSADKGGVDYGNSILKMSLQNAGGARDGVLDANSQRLAITDYFTPFNWKVLEMTDQDIGSAGLLLVPGTSLAITGDKPGRYYVVDTNNMGHFQSGSNSQIVNDFQGFKGHLHGGPVYYNSSKWGPLIYSWAEHDYLQAHRVSDLATKGFKGTPFLRSNIAAPPGMPGGFLSVSGNGNALNTGIVWAYLPYEGDANRGVVPGVLRAFDANDPTRELWNSHLNFSRDYTGLFAKFSNPTIADGKVFVSSFSNQLNVYGLLPRTAIPTAPTNLSAQAGPGRVSLSWQSVSGATCYSVKRATSASGPYTLLNNNVLGTSFQDSNVQNGTEYFYLVSASSAGGESPNSNRVSATPFAPAPGTVISVDFNGSSPYFGAVTPMESSEVAGIVAAPNWNVAMGLSGSIVNLRTNGGAQSSATGTWSSKGAVSTGIPDTPGNNRMMKGYLANDDTTPITFDITKLPSAFVSAGYDVYVYSDGVNPTATRTAQFGLGSTVAGVVDAQNRNFEGTFSFPGAAGVGNAFVFKNISITNFKLSVTQGASGDTTPRAPINGLQIVMHQSAPTAISAPTNLVAMPGNNQVSLTWKAVTSADYYTLRRSTVAGGPYTTLVGDRIRGTGWGDPDVLNGKTYFYAVTATRGGVLSANSNEARATPSSAYVGKIISVDFGPTSPAMADSESAGSSGVARPNWNRAADVSGNLTALKDDKGTSTSTSLGWQGEIAANTSITDAAGDRRMMRSFLSGKVNPATVTLSNLPADFTKNGYDIYLYYDNNNAGARSGLYTAATTPVSGTDAAGTNFSGAYQQGNNATGNFVKLMGFFSPSITLTAKSKASADAEPGGPINGLQIVARNPDAVLTSTPQSVRVAPNSGTSVAGTARAISAIYGDGEGAADIAAAYLRVGTGTTDAAPLDVYYNGLQNLLYLYNGSAWIGGFAPGSANIISGPRGSVDCSKTTVVLEGSVLTVNWNLTPSSALVGSKSILCRVQDKSNRWDKWRTLGTWKITAPSPTSARTTTSVPSS